MLAIKFITKHEDQLTTPFIEKIKTDL